MAKNLQVNLAFTADTNAAMQNLQTLRNSLNEISSLPFTVGKGLNSDLQMAANSAQQLQRHLGAAMDVKTGNLNLNKLQTSLKSSNQSLSQLTSGLLHAGVAGEKAFISTYSAIAQSNLQLRKSNTLLSQFALTLKNTVKWQLSSSLLHGLISGFSSAIGYAKDLNASLNHIQIVTGQSSEQMAEFAKYANKAAKELRSTTVAYTDAALIYYQQGLKGKAVTDRADTTVKLANVTGESAETVSQWMTAVWNNFDDGSKKLEYYADVMTALGAATASSSDEIAQGLEKFAAVADTVGLSYENATAALATITATTRQSADVVGTALKTLFARIQDLDLGKTLEDGTTLGSYSESLAKVGINIKDASGQLKDMDIILDEMGNKWKELDQDQQVALAKNVAGIRQYTQLIALMDNYDFYKQNQDVALGAEGTLEKQAEMYEQSWAAASKNVKASLEEMYNVLIPTDFIVDFTNGLADVVSGFTDILDAAGGLRTILFMISSVVLSKFQTQIAMSLQTGIDKTQTLISSVKNAGDIFSVMGNRIKESWVNAAQGGSRQAVNNMNKEPTNAKTIDTKQGLNNALTQTDASGNKIALTEGFVAQVKSLQQIEHYNTQILNLKNQMTAAEFEGLQLEQQQLKTLGEQIAAKKQYISDLELEKQNLIDIQNYSGNRVSTYEQTNGRIATSNTSDILNNSDEKLGYRMGAKLADATGSGDVRTAFQSEGGSAVGVMSFANEEAVLQAKTQILQVVSDTASLEAEINTVLDDTVMSEDQKAKRIDEIIAKKEKEKTITSSVAKELRSSLGIIKNADGSTRSMTVNTGKLKTTISSVSTGVKKVAKQLGVTEEHIANTVNISKKQVKAQTEINSLSGQQAQITQRIEEGIKRVIDRAGSIGTVLTKGMQGFSQMAMGISMMQSAVVSLGEAFDEGKFNLSSFLSGLTSLGMAIPILTGGFKTLMGAVSSVTDVQNIANSTMGTQLVQMGLVTAGHGANAAAILTEAGAEKIATVAKNTGISADKIKIAISALSKGAKLSEALATAGLTSAEWAQVAANLGLQASMWPVLLITLAVVAAFAVLVAIIVGVVSIVNMLSDAYNADAIAAAEANKQAELMAEKYKTLTEEANKFKEAVTGYEEAVNNLKKLKEGTYEYEEALAEANAKAMELIETYELWGQFQKENGLIVFNDDVLKQIENENQRKVEAAQASVYASKITANAAQLKSDRTDAKRDIGSVVAYEAYDPNGYETTYYRQFKDDEMKSVITAFGDLENAVGMSDEALTNYLTNQAGLPDAIKNEIDSIVQNRNEFEKLAESTEQAALANETYAKELMGIAVTNTDEEKNAFLEAANSDEGLSNQMINAAAARFAKDITNDKGQTQTEALEAIDVSDIASNSSLEDVAENSINEDFKSDFVDMDDEKTARMYAKYILGREDYDELTYEGGNGIGTLKSTDGTETYIDEADDDEMRRALARYIKTEDINDEFDTKSNEASDAFLNAMTKLADSGELGKSIIASLEDGAENANFSEMYGMISSTEERDELKNLSAEELAAKLDMSSEDFTALGYQSAADFEAAFDKGLEGWSIEAFKAAEQAKADAIIAQGAEKYELDEAVLKKQTELLQANIDGLKDNAEAAAKMAVANQRMNKGVDTLSDNWEDWKKTLKGTDKTTQEYAKALVEAESAMADILNLSDDEIIPAGFLEVPENLNLLDAIADGSEEAVEQLSLNLAKAQIESQEFSAQISHNLTSAFQFEEDTNLAEVFANIKDNAISALTEIQNMANGLDIGVGLKDPAKQAELAQALNDYAIATGMTADQMQSMLNKVGVTAQIDMIEGNPVTKQIPTTKITRKRTKNNIFTGEQEWEETASVIDYTTVTEPTLVPQIKMTGEGESSAPTQPIFNKVSMGTITPSVTTSGKSSGGGGGSSSKTATKQKKTISNEGDFYHDINREIERLAKSTEKLAEAKDRAFGDNKIKNLNAEIKAIDKEIAAQDKLIKRAEEKLKLDQEALKTYGAKYDENGEITNYDEMLQNEVNKYNAAVDEYNRKAALKDAGQLSDEAWEQAEKDFEAAEERYSGFEEAVDTYEADLDIKDDAVEEKAAKIREKLDRQLEGIQYSIDIQIEVNERDLKVLERLLERLDDDAFDGADRIANMTKQIDEQFDNIEIYKAGIRQTLVSAGADQAAVDAYMAGDSTAIQGLDLNDEQMQMLMDYTDGIMESEDAILELREEIENQVMTTFDAWHEKIEANSCAFEHATSMAESYKNIIDLVGKTRLNIDNSILKDLEDTQMKAADGAMKNAKAQMETTQSALNKAKEELEKAKERGNKDDIEKWEKDIETLNNTLMEDQEAFMSSWETALQTATDIFTAQMDRAFEKLEDDLAGIFKSFDELGATMDKQQQVSDRFMDAGKKQYELSKLNRQLQKNLDKTDSAKAQQELLKLQKEIEGYQESGVEMSERDLAALQKKYELRLAEIALEDAQNAKSQVRLQRDSEGNFSYVYTTDASKAADAQQAYEDKLEENRQLAISQNEELTNAIVENRQAMVEALRNIRQEDYEDTEAYMQALQNTAQFYKDQEAYLIGETQKVIERSQDIYENDYLAYDGWNLQKLNNTDNYNAKLSETQLQAQAQLGINTNGWVAQETQIMKQLGINILDAIQNGDGSSGINGLMIALGSAEDGTGFFGESKSAAEKWEENIEIIMNNAGIDISNIKTKADEGLGKDGAQKSFVDFKTAVTEALYGKDGSKTTPAEDSVNGAMAAATEKINTLQSTAETQFGKVTSSVTTWQSTYSGKVDASKTSTDNLNTSIKNLLGKEIEVIAKVKGQTDVDKLKETIEGLGDKTVNIKNNTTNTITTEYKTTGDAPATGGTQGDGTPQVGDTVTFESGVYTADSYGGGSSGSMGRGGAMKISLITNTNRARPYHLTTTSGGARGWVSLSQISGYDTGGYTGDWGPDGKLAFLHQKEIVLNASDTENLLTAVSMIREISDQLESNALAMKYLNALGEIRTNITNNNKETLEQEVTIHAEFPNATNHTEIEEAFRNLSTLASQYANRKN